ncbi:type II toxin-antitoxin system mRNA interferase toxin, RelE/StbE family [Arthrobacter wenxiniae]|uniref:Type II toxin-antitoxin system RelE/ParE family toxin n=1 Tax=Arthrobacter wenxiniae TaxID=2713570 RepID=A0A7Y7IHS6_9MICC|nr:type II toxin-antitoxin system RelE/ParE family toxin [Arthrobacter wenxiniae]
MTSPCHVETTAEFDREYKKLDRAVQKRVMAYLEESETLDDPRQRGKGLAANHSGVRRYRVGDYRILAQITDSTFTVLAIRVGHRRDIY